VSLEPERRLPITLAYDTPKGAKEAESARNRPTVAVIMPFLNTEEFLEEAIQSVVHQTMPCWELILVDDGSTDRSGEIARRYAERDPARIRLLRHPDRASHGSSAARNLGLANARGSWIALLDSDDVWLPDKLERQLALLEQNPTVDVLYGRTRQWYGWTGKLDDRRRDVTPRLGVRPLTVMEPPDLLELCLKCVATLPATSSIVVRRSVVDRTGVFEEAFRDVYDDQVFYAKLFLEARAMAVDECWDLYRRHPASVSWQMDARGQDVVARTRYLHWLKDALQSGELRNQRIEAVVRREIRWLNRSKVAKRARGVANRLRRRGLEISMLWRGSRADTTDRSAPSARARIHR